MIVVITSSDVCSCDDFESLRYNLPTPNTLGKGPGLMRSTLSNPSPSTTRCDMLYTI